MNTIKYLMAHFETTLKDGNFSRGEKKAITRAIQGIPWDTRKISLVRNRLFALAKGRHATRSVHQTMDWLDTALKALPMPKSSEATSMVFFSPGNACLNALKSLLNKARSSVDICVFTLTDNRIRNSILACRRRGVPVRIITDNHKALDLGSDVLELVRLGIPVKSDDTPDHMHHKFAVIDRNTLVNGSYNWTRSAAEANFENIVVTDEPKTVAAFSREFEKLWKQMKSLKP